MLLQGKHACLLLPGKTRAWDYGVVGKLHNADGLRNRGIWGTLLTGEHCPL